MPLLLFLATCFLAYSTGANDNFKGVASLFGSRTTDYRWAIVWATVTTFAGSICALFVAQGLLKAFSGKGLVPDHVASSEYFLLAVALGAGVTVIAATLLGFPISTTHALTGAIVGSGFLASQASVNLRALGSGFVLPLLLTPFLAVLLSALFYLFLRFLRIRFGISKEWCVCIGAMEQLVPIPQPGSALAPQSVATPVLAISVGVTGQCSERYAGRFLGLESQKLMDGLHFFSAGVVSFARGLNDTPKDCRDAFSDPCARYPFGDGGAGNRYRNGRHVERSESGRDNELENHFHESWAGIRRESVHRRLGDPGEPLRFAGFDNARIRRCSGRHRIHPEGGQREGSSRNRIVLGADLAVCGAFSGAHLVGGNEDLTWRICPI